MVIYQVIRAGGPEFEPCLCFTSYLKVPRLGAHLLRGSLDPHVKGIVEIMFKKLNYHFLTIKAFGTISDLSIKKYPKAV